MYSDDQGMTWTPATGDMFGSAGLGVEYHGGRWIALGYGTRTILYSDDGATWTTAGDPFGSGAGYGATWNGSRWVAVGQGSSYDAVYSDDNGITWYGAYSLSYSGYRMFEVAWGAGRFVAVSNDDNSVAYSDDGISWTPGGNPFGGGLGGAYGYAVEYGDGIFVAGGEYGTDVIITSSDGINWAGTGDATFSFVWDLDFEAAITHTLTYIAGPNGSVVGITPQVIVDGMDGSEVTAVPDSGFHFVDWSDASAANPRTDSGVTEDITVTANFEIDDTIPPLRMNGIPTGELVSGTTSADISLDTDESAICKYDTIPGTDYVSMSYAFDTIGSISHSTNVTGLEDGNSYVYYVRCEDGLGNTNPDDFTISFSVGIPPATDLAAPTDLEAKAKSSSEINLEWKDSSDNEAGFKIERKKDGDNWKTIHTTEANDTEYADEDLDPGTEYTYRVRTYLDDQYSDYSNRDSATTDDTKLKIDSIGASCNSLTITLDAGDEYDNNKEDVEIEVRSTRSGNEYAETYPDTKFDSDGKVTLAFTGLKGGTEFEVRARLDDADWSLKQSVTTKTCEAVVAPAVTTPVTATPTAEQPKTEEPKQEESKEDQKPIQQPQPGLLRPVESQAAEPVIESQGMSTAAMAGTAGAAVVGGAAWFGIFILRQKRVSGFVLESQNRSPLSGVDLDILTPDGQSIKRLATGSDGSFSLRLKPGPYHVSAQKSGYIFPSKIIQGQDSQLGTVCSGNFTVGADGEMHLMLAMDRENTTV